MITLKEVPLFKDFSESDLQILKSCLREKKFEAGEVLFLEGKPCERVYIVKEGRVKLYRISPNGREQILEVLGPGDTCACNSGEKSWTCGSTSEAIENSAVWFLSRENYAQMMKTNTHISQNLNNLFAEKLKCFGSLIEEVSLKDAKKRLIKFLLDMIKEAPASGQKEGVLEIPFTREELAQRIGTARETVARHLYQLKRANLIDIKPHQILILNKPALEKLLID